MYHLIQNSCNYSKTFGSLWQYYRDEPALNTDGSNIDFPDDKNSASLKFKQKITGQTGSEGTKDVETIVPLKDLRNFWRNLEMLFTNCENNLILTWSANCFIKTTAIDDQVPRFPQ